MSQLLVNLISKKVILYNSVPVAVVGGEGDALLGRGPVLVDVVDAEIVVGGEDDDVAVEGGAGVELHLFIFQGTCVFNRNNLK